MKHFSKIIRLPIILLMLAGCSEALDPDSLEDMSVGDQISHEMIVLGDQLEDPYSVKNITKAISNLYPTKAEREDVMPTDIYLRFLPETDAEYEKLVSLGLELMDHPLDYQIIKDGDYYHDPSVNEEKITWQYAVVPKDFKIPGDIRCEILDECFIPETSTKSDGMDWDEIEREAFRLTGNMDLYESQTKASSVHPKGRITIVDPEANGGKPFGVAGVKIICNTFVKYSSTYTDRDGYYEIGKKYRSKVRYRLRFKNKQGFAIGFNLLLVQASTSALGKASPDGLDYTITSDSDRKLFCRCVVNNAGYEYYLRCAEDDLNILPPPGKLRLWIFQNLSCSSAAMLKHGTYLENSILGKYFGKYIPLLKIFLPDITIGVKGTEKYSELYSLTCHELAHASLYAKVGNSWWNSYINYTIGCFVKNMKVDYGSGKEKNSGLCELSEMWSYFLENSMYHDRYGGAMPNFGMEFWFRPQIFMYLNERGLSVSQLFQALKGNTLNADELQKSLLELYPDKSSIITQAFTRYSE